jgi:hypothetical protein
MKERIMNRDSVKTVILGLIVAAALVGSLAVKLEAPKGPAWNTLSP